MMLKASVTSWLTHGSASKCGLDCFAELLETLDEIFNVTREADVPGF